MIVSILANWYLAKAYAATKKGGLVTAAIVGNLAVLGFFKYTNFLADTFAAIGIPAGHIDIALPLGISFFTFHHIMYLVDLRAGRAPLYPLDRYALYICYFPQAISGPLARWSEVMDQFGQKMLRPGWEKRCAFGVALIVLGLLQKTLLADPLADRHRSGLCRSAQGPGGRRQILDRARLRVSRSCSTFSGYSDIAIGVALIFGVQLPQNFDAPFRTTSIIRDFWRALAHDAFALPARLCLHFAVRLRIGGSRYGMTGPCRDVQTMATVRPLAWRRLDLRPLGHPAGLAVVAATLGPYLPGPPAIIGWAADVGLLHLQLRVLPRRIAAGRLAHLRGPCDPAARSP